MAVTSEDTLDNHFLFYISFANTYYPCVTNDRDRKLADQWLEKLCTMKVHGVSEKRNRNSFLAYFLMNLQEGRMSGPFAKSPANGPLPPARKIFSEEETAEPSSCKQGESADEDIGDFEERSGDGRTYVAIKCLPNNRGTYGVVALTLDKDENDGQDVTVVPCSVDRSKLRHIRALHKLANSGNKLGSHPSESQMEDFYMRNIETKISGDISELYKALTFPPGQPCGRDPAEIAYYELLLNQIDEEITGVVTGENELVRFLVKRLAQDLKKVPKMQHLFKLSPEQQNLRLLEILRQKLVIRQQEEKRRNLLAEMEEKILCLGARSDCCMGRSDVTTESMWQLAVTRPLPLPDMNKLSSVYPENAIGTFLDLLADDRSVILERGKKRQKKTIGSLRSEVYREIQSGKTEYNNARAAYREWNEILSIVEEMMYEASNKLLDEDPETADESGKNDALLANMISNIKETKNLVITEAERAEMLTEKIADANTWKFSLQDDQGQDSSWDMKSSIEMARREIESCKLVIERQNRRIEELRGQLDYE